MKVNDRLADAVGVEPSPSELIASMKAKAATQTDTVLSMIREHPDWTTRQISEHTGIKTNRIDTIARKAGVYPRRLTPEEIREATLKGAKMGGEAVRGTRSPIVKRVIEVQAEHPDWFVKQIAEVAGTSPENVRSISDRYNLNVPKVPNFGRPAKPAATPENRPAETQEAAPAPDPQPEPLAAPAPSLPADDGALSRLRKYGAPDPASEPAAPEPAYVHPSVAKFNKPGGKTLMLKDRDTGLFLHQDLNAMSDGALRMVSRREYSWAGKTLKHVAAVRRLLPSTERLVVVQVTA